LKAKQLGNEKRGKETAGKFMKKIAAGIKAGASPSRGTKLFLG